MSPMPDESRTTVRQQIKAFLQSEWREISQYRAVFVREGFSGRILVRLLFREWLWVMVLFMTILDLILLSDSLYMSRHKEFGIVLVLALMTACGWFMLVWRVGSPSVTNED
jgi:hypothetical protein